MDRCRPTCTRQTACGGASGRAGSGAAMAAAALLVGIYAASSDLIRDRPPAPERGDPFSVCPPPGRVCGAKFFCAGPAKAGYTGWTQARLRRRRTTSQLFLWLRALDEPAARHLNGTEDAAVRSGRPTAGRSDFFGRGSSKDQRGGRLFARGGQHRVTADSRGGAWSPADVILYSPSSQSGLARVASTGAPRRPSGSPIRLA